MLIFEGLWGNFGIMLEIFSRVKIDKTTRLSLLDLTVINLKVKV